MSILTCIFLASFPCQAIALFNANRQGEAMQRIKELANICPDADTIACHVVEVSIIGFFPSVDAYPLATGIFTYPTWNQGVE